MAVHGRVRDTLWDARRRVSLRTDWRDNLVTFAFADAIGELLVGSRHARRLGWLAVGRGDNSWDAAAPAPDRGRRALHDEMARLPLVPGSTLTYHPRLRQVRASARFGPGTATGSIRELGVIAGVLDRHQFRVGSAAGQDQPGEAGDIAHRHRQERGRDEVGGERQVHDQVPAPDLEAADGKSRQRRDSSTKLCEFDFYYKLNRHSSLV